MRTASLLALVALLLAACSSDVSSSDVEDGITATQINGVWVFHHAPDSAMNALHSGFPEVIDGCLMIDNTVVVWHTDDLDQARDAVEAANAGEQPQLLIGGGGISTDEGTDPADLPGVITDRCSTGAVWFGAP